MTCPKSDVYCASFILAPEEEKIEGNPTEQGYGKDANKIEVVEILELGFGRGAGNF